MDPYGSPSKRHLGVCAIYSETTVIVSEGLQLEKKELLYGKVRILDLKNKSKKVKKKVNWQSQSQKKSN